MAFISSSSEYALHCLLWLVAPQGRPISSRDLAEMQGVSPALLAKIYPKLERAGIVEAIVGIGGGYRLALDPRSITVLDVVEAVEGTKPLFKCRDIRRNCALFEANPPSWSTVGICEIHAVMLRAERAMRDELSRTNILELAQGVPAPIEFMQIVRTWFDQRATGRELSRQAAMRRSRTKGSPAD